MSADIKRRLSRLEDAERPGPDGGRQREEERKRRIRSKPSTLTTAGGAKRLAEGLSLT
jgi:hypothetical protein